MSVVNPKLNHIRDYLWSIWEGVPNEDVLITIRFAGTLKRLRLL